MILVLLKAMINWNNNDDDESIDINNVWNNDNWKCEMILLMKLKKWWRNDDIEIMIVLMKMILIIN